jgi:hypothetical protein
MQRVIYRIYKCDRAMLRQEQPKLVIRKNEVKMWRLLLALAWGQNNRKILEGRAYRYSLVY